MIYYPKKELKKIIATYIRSSIFNGVYWFNYNNNPQIDNLYYNLTQEIILKRQTVSEIINRKETPDLKTIIINPNIFNIVAAELLIDFYKQNPKFPKLKNEYNLNQIRLNEIKYFAQYINMLKEDQIDVFLYKVEGGRNQLLMLHENNQLYKKPIVGFYLTEKDIEDVNIELAKYDKKIYEIQEKESIVPCWGIRYTLYISKAVRL